MTDYSARSGLSMLELGGCEGRCGIFRHDSSLGSGKNESGERQHFLCLAMFKVRNQRRDVHGRGGLTLRPARLPVSQGTDKHLLSAR